MFKINDIVVYGNSEIYLIKEIKTPDFIKTDEKYYFLQSILDERSIIYVQTNNLHKTMRKIISKDEADNILKEIPNILPLYNQNDNAREKEYSNIISSCDCFDLISALKGLNNEQKRRRENNSKLNMTDEKNFRKIKTFLTTELSIAFDINIEKANDLLLGFGL